MLRIGCVKYLNAQPLIRGWEGDVEFEHPSTLCSRLSDGKLDVALVSSFEFLRNPIYRIVDDVSISSDGPVYSVVVAHRGDLSDIEVIELDPASETSVNLLRCLLAELGLNLRLAQHKTGLAAAVTDSDTDGRAQLLIGDQAIHFRQKYGNEFSFWDLGEQWQKFVGLPFVYALWLIRPELADPNQVADRLRRLRDENLARLDHVIEDAVAAGGLSFRSSTANANDPGQQKALNREFLSRYYREHLRFGFGQREREGLQTFARLCSAHNLILKRDLALGVV